MQSVQGWVEHVPQATFFRIFVQYLQTLPFLKPLQSVSVSIMHLKWALLILGAVSTVSSRTLGHVGEHRKLQQVALTEQPTPLEPVNTMPTPLVGPGGAIPAQELTLAPGGEILETQQGEAAISGLIESIGLAPNEEFFLAPGAEGLTFSEANVALTQAAAAGNLAAVEDLLALPEGSRPDPSNNDTGTTPIIAALINPAGEPNYEVASALIDGGADINKPAEDGTTPLKAMVLDRNLEGVQFVVENGGDVNLPAGPDGLTPFQEAVLTRRRAIVDFMIEQNAADVNLPDPSGRTPIFYVLEDQNPDLEWVTLLINYGADANFPGPDGSTPLDLAQASGNPDIISVVLSAASAPAPEMEFSMTEVEPAEPADTATAVPAEGATTPPETTDTVPAEGATTPPETTDTVPAEGGGVQTQG